MIISTIIPAYNAEKYLKQAIDSVLVQKTENLFDIEVIVVDDCSRDNTDFVMIEYQRNPRVRVIKNSTNLGVAQSRNRGVEEAKGDLIAFLDADDWWEPEKLLLEYKKLKSKDAALVCTGRALVNPDGSTADRYIPVPDIITNKMLLKTNYIPCSSALVKKVALEEFPMEHDELHEDYICWLRITKKYGPAYGVNMPLVNCRLSEGGKSRNKLKSAVMHFKCYRVLGYSIPASIGYFFSYAINGVKKYYG